MRTVSVPRTLVNAQNERFGERLAVSLLGGKSAAISFVESTRRSDLCWAKTSNQGTHAEN